MNLNFFLPGADTGMHRVVIRRAAWNDVYERLSLALPQDRFVSQYQNLLTLSSPEHVARFKCNAQRFSDMFKEAECKHQFCTDFFLGAFRNPHELQSRAYAALESKLIEPKSIYVWYLQGLALSQIYSVLEGIPETALSH